MNPRTLRITYFDGANEHEIYQAVEKAEGWSMKALLDLPKIQELVKDENALYTLFFLGAEAARLQGLHRQRPLAIDPQSVQAAAYIDCEPGTVVHITHDGEFVQTVLAHEHGAIVVPVKEGDRWMTLCALTRHARVTTYAPIAPTIKNIADELDRAEVEQVSGPQLVEAMCLQAPTTKQMRDIAESMRWLGWESFKTRTGTCYRRQTMSAVRPEVQRVQEWLSGPAADQQSVTGDEVLDAMRWSGERALWVHDAVVGLMSSLGWMGRMAKKGGFEFIRRGA